MLYILNEDLVVIATWHYGTNLNLSEKTITERAIMIQANGDELRAIERQGLPVNRDGRVTYLYGDLAKTFLLNIR